MCESSGQFGCPDMSDLSDVQTDTRCHVIKCLQEQVTSMQQDQTNCERLQSRLQLLERTMQLREAEYKLKIDDLQDIIAQLKAENADLHKHLEKPKKPVPLIVTHEDGIMTEKYKKWKSKFKSLLETDPSYETAAQVFHLKEEIKSLHEEIERLNAANESECDKNRQLAGQVGEAEAQVKKAKDAAAESNAKVEKLQQKIASLREANKKLVSEKKHKTSLLKHTRTKQEKVMRTQQEAEASAKQEMEARKKTEADHMLEMAKLKERLEREIREKKQLVKELSQLKKKHGISVDKLKADISSLHDRNDALAKQLDESRSDSSALEMNITELKAQNEELASTVKKTAKMRKQNEALHESICDMQTTIEALQSSVSSAEEDAKAKIAELRRLLAKSFTNIEPTCGWDEIMSDISELIEKYQSASDTNENQQKQIRKLCKAKESLEKQSEQKKDDDRRETARIEESLRQCQEELANLKGRIYGNTAKYRWALRRKIEAHFSEANRKVAEAISILTNEEPPIVPNFRSLLLTTVFLTRWKNYKQSEPFDASVIEEFASRELSRTGILNDLLAKAREVAAKISRAEDRADALNKQDEESKAQILKLQQELKAAQDNALKHIQATSDLTRNLEEAQRRINDMISPEQYKDLQVKLEKKGVECQSIEQQLTDLKYEMKRLLTTMDTKNFNYSELQDTIELMTEENETLKQQIASIRQELEIAQAALRERDREVLAIERRMMKQRAQVVVVKDKLPICETPATPPKEVAEPPKENFFLSAALRTGLAEMQSKMMRQEKLI